MSEISELPDMSRFCDTKGEIIRWVNIFKAHDPNAFYRTKKATFPFEVHQVRPWFMDGDIIDLDLIVGLQRLGAFDRYPVQWRNADWEIKSQNNSPWYGILSYGPGDNDFRSALYDFIYKDRDDAPISKANAVWHGTAPNFSARSDTWKAMQKLVLVPRDNGSTLPSFYYQPQKEFEDESFRFDPNRARIVRD